MNNRFWQRQRGMDDTILIGRELIEVQVSSSSFHYVLVYSLSVRSA